MILELAAKIVTVIGLGVMELWVAIPVGTALSLHPVVNGFASGLGAITGALLVIMIGDRVRRWLLKGKDKAREDKGWIYRIWEKYGVIGLGMLSPLLTGAPLGAAIGISLGAQPKRLLFWMGMGIVVWAVLLTAACTLGFVAIESLA